MKLKYLLREIPFACVKGNPNLHITDIIYDSRKARKGTVFVCMPGVNADGHDFIPSVLAAGVRAIVVQRAVDVTRDDVCVIRVESTRKALSYMSAAYFRFPAEKLVTIGLTGTKGKTSTSYMIKSILEEAGRKTGLIGTLGAVIGTEQISLPNTTPESYELQKLLHKMVETGCEYVVMEVSSQGLKQERVAGLSFHYGVFTNFSPDHIGPGEHDDLDEYLSCKSILFRQCDTGIINLDDNNQKNVLKGHTCKVKTFGCGNHADLTAENISLIRNSGKPGIRFCTKGAVDTEISVYIPGKFNVYNSLAAMMVCDELGIGVTSMKTALQNIRVRGRVELVPVSDRFTVLIDYAHNKASTRSIMHTLREYEPNRIICVYGAGGNRPKLRRYDMGEATGETADLCILTSDNPRDEEPEDIIEDIKVGLARSGGEYKVIIDRKEAIAHALAVAEDGDIILLLGKGHEDYQEVKGIKYPFDERLMIRELIKGQEL